MLDIPFSQNFLKFPRCVRVADTHLVGLFKVHKSRLPDWFLRYDTAYMGEDGKVHYYPLKDTELIVLLLATTPYTNLAQQFLNLWTTCRTWDEGKEEMYRQETGNIVKIKIAEV